MEVHHAVQAAVVVERLFPPRTTDDVFRILASLNLLNTAVKRPWGKHVVKYQYIKGMAACLYTYLSSHPLDRIHLYHSQTDQVTYFRVFGVQVSFHYLPHYSLSRSLGAGRQAEEQTWDGIRLQQMAVEFFRLAVPEDVHYSEDEAWQARRLMLRCARPLYSAVGNAGLLEARAMHHGEQKDGGKGMGGEEGVPSSVTVVMPCRHRKRLLKCQMFAEDKSVSLRHALSFNIWRSTDFLLFRRKDHRLLPVIRYDGSNYEELLTRLVGNHPRIFRRKKGSLEVGKFYYISPKMRLRSLSLSTYIITMTQNCYLVRDGNYSNLCITYGIALYLASRFPLLWFVNTLDYNRRLNKREYYGYEQLLRVPLGADERRLKVWMVVDLTYALRDFDVCDLPQRLVDEYLAAEDYYMEFQLIRQDGFLGIMAYRRHLILPPAYAYIEIRNYHARVMRRDGKWAVFSLGREHFVSGFIYDRIWYDESRYIIYGEVDGQDTVIYSFFPP